MERDELIAISSDPDAGVARAALHAIFLLARKNRCPAKFFQRLRELSPYSGLYRWIRRAAIALEK
jgi:hypothetical protein